MDKKYLNFAIAIIAALLAVFLFNSYVKQREAALASKQPPQIKVLVAAKDIKRAEVIKSEMLAFRLIPKDYVQPKALIAVQEAVDKIAARDILAGEQINITAIVNAQTGLTLAEQTPPGKRAVTINVDSVSSVGGMVQPGDAVDVLGVFDVPVIVSGKETKQPSVVTLFQNIPVLAVGSDTAADASADAQKRPPSRAGFVTLALNPQDTELILFAQTVGKIRLILRGSKDNEITPATKTSQEMKQYIIDLMEKKVQKQPEAVKATPEKKKIEIFQGIKKRDDKK